MAESALPHRDAVDAFVGRVEDEDIDVVQRIYLFGSVAQGVHRLRDVAYDVMLERGAVFSIHAVTESTLEQRSDHPFFRTVLDEGQAVYG